MTYLLDRKVWWILSKMGHPTVYSSKHIMSFKQLDISRTHFSPTSLYLFLSFFIFFIYSRLVRFWWVKLSSQKLYKGHQKCKYSWCDAFKTAHEKISSGWAVSWSVVGWGRKQLYFWWWPSFTMQPFPPSSVLAPFIFSPSPIPLFSPLPPKTLFPTLPTCFYFFKFKNH